MRLRAVLLVLSFSLLSAASAAAAPLVIAHRGASGYLPEHTLPAKAMAYAQGADFLEQDLVLSKDDVPVVLHDVHIDGVTDVALRFPERKRPDGRYYALDFTVAELKQLKVTERFNPRTGQRAFPGRFPAGESSFQISTFEEELQFIRGLNRSTGRSVGIYPELKEPRWHRDQGRDLSRIALDILQRYGYATKADACFLQCFDFAELTRVRNELGWRGRSLMLLDEAEDGKGATTHAVYYTPAGLRELAKVVDGIGPPLGEIVRWDESGKAIVSDLVQKAHAARLLVHPYTVRRDALPPRCPSIEALHEALFGPAGVDGVFTDFPDLTVAAAQGRP